MSYQANPGGGAPPVFCSNCGTQNPPTATFCSSCGTTIKPATPPLGSYPAGQQPYVAPPPSPSYAQQPPTQPENYYANQPYQQYPQPPAGSVPARKKSWLIPALLIGVLLIAVGVGAFLLLGKKTNKDRILGTWSYQVQGENEKGTAIFTKDGKIYVGRADSSSSGDGTLGNYTLIGDKQDQITLTVDNKPTTYPVNFNSDDLFVLQGENASVVTFTRVSTNETLPQLPK